MTTDIERDDQVKDPDLKELVEGVKAISEGNYDREVNTVLKGELSSLARYINETRKMLAGMRPELSYAADNLPNAFDTLQDICNTTEVATHNILSIVENLLDTDDELESSVKTVTEYLEKKRFGTNHRSNEEAGTGSLRPVGIVDGVDDPFVFPGSHKPNHRQDWQDDQRSRGTHSLLVGHLGRNHGRNRVRKSSPFRPGTPERKPGRSFPAKPRR